MKKVICKIEYDTDASELIQKKVFGVFGDPKGYEESLYKTKDGKFFLYGFGGSESPYTEETITRLAANKVKVSNSFGLFSYVFYAVIKYNLHIIL